MNHLGIFLYAVFLLTMGGIYAVLPSAQHSGAHRTVQCGGGGFFRSELRQRHLPPPSTRHLGGSTSRPCRPSARDDRERDRRVGVGGLHPARSDYRRSRTLGIAEILRSCQNRSGHQRGGGLADSEAVRAVSSREPGRECCCRVRLVLVLVPAPSAAAGPPGGG